MKVIIAGSRTITNYDLVEDHILQSGFAIEEVVCGEASGVDSLGKEYAEQFQVPVTSFKPNWKEEGKAAGPIRNRKMAEYADALIAIWDGKSRGTLNMIQEAVKRGLLLYVVTLIERETCSRHKTK